MSKCASCKYAVKIYYRDIYDVEHVAICDCTKCVLDETTCKEYEKREIKEND